MNVDFTNRSKCDENNNNLGHTKLVTPFSVAEIQVCVCLLVNISETVLSDYMMFSRYPISITVLCYMFMASDKEVINS